MEGKKRCKGFVIRRNALCRYEKRQRYNFKNPIWVNSVSSVPLNMIQFRSGCENESSHEIKNEAATPIPVLPTLHTPRTPHTTSKEENKFSNSFYHIRLLVLTDAICTVFASMIF